MCEREPLLFAHDYVKCYVIGTGLVAGVFAGVLIWRSIA